LIDLDIELLPAEKNTPPSLVQSLIKGHGREVGVPKR
jgi:hypothetical protein